MLTSVSSRTIIPRKTNFGSKTNLLSATCDLQLRAFPTLPSPTMLAAASQALANQETP